MALIEKIRKQNWLLIVLIGFALFAFLLMDMGSGKMGGGQSSLGTVAGKNIDYREFSRAENALYSGASGDVFSRRNSLWNYFVEEALVKKEADALGIGISPEELTDLQYGDDSKLSPIISSRFRNQQGQVDRQQLNQIKDLIDRNELNPEFGDYWRYTQKQVIKDQLQSKLSNMVSKAIYTPNWMVEQANIDQNQKMSFSYVRIPFAEVDDSEVELTDADYNTYLADNKAHYIQDEETRRVEYVTFNVLPTATDSANIEAGMVEMRREFEATNDDSSFVDINYGTISGTYFSKDDQNPQTRQAILSDIIADTIFRIPVGSAFGPYIENNEYRLVKVLDRQIMPDSAKSRHILINANSPASFLAAEKTIDSLKNLVLAGTHRFDSLAAAFSQDPGSKAKGGEYDFVGPTSFVPEFSDIIFFKGEIGKMYSTRTQYGVHLIEPMARKSQTTPRVKLAFVSKPIVPSDDTQRNRYDEVSKFVETNRTIEDLAANAQGLANVEVETSTGLKLNDFNIGTLGSDQSSRDIIRWAFSSDKGEVSPSVYRYRDPVNNFESKYVVVGLKGVQAAGSASLNDIKSDLEAVVRNNKKGEIIKSKISGSNLNSIANSFESKVDTATNVSFTSGFVTGLGEEPKVISNAFSLDLNTVSQPIIGKDGVYIIQPFAKPAVAAPANTATLRQQVSRTTQGQVRGQLIQAMKKNVDIEDQRSTFY